MWCEQVNDIRNIDIRQYTVYTTITLKSMLNNYHNSCFMIMMSIKKNIGMTFL